MWFHTFFTHRHEIPAPNVYSFVPPNVKLKPTECVSTAHIQQYLMKL